VVKTLNTSETTENDLASLMMVKKKIITIICQITGIRGINFRSLKSFSQKKRQGSFYQAYPLDVHARGNSWVRRVFQVMDQKMN